VTILTG